MIFFVEVLSNSPDYLDLEYPEYIYKNNPFFNSVYLSLALKHFGRKSLVKRITNDNGNTEFFLQKTNIFTYSSFLPAQSQVSPVFCSSLSPNKIKSLFKVLSPALKIDLLALDEKYIAKSSINYKFADFLDHATTMSIEVTDTFDVYWENRSKNLRKKLKKYINKLEKDFGGYRFVVNESEESIASSVNTYGELESRGWKGDNGTALHPLNQQGIFYSDLLKGFNGSNLQSFVFELEVDGKVIASRLCVCSNRTIVILKSTHDEDFKPYAPGKTLLYLVVNYIFEMGRYDTIEFYTNATEEQLKWATNTRKIYHVTLYRNKVVYSFIKLIKKLTN